MSWNLDCHINHENDMSWKLRRQKIPHFFFLHINTCTWQETRNQRKSETKANVLRLNWFEGEKKKTLPIFELSLFCFTHVIEKEFKEKGFPLPRKKKFLRYFLGGIIKTVFIFISAATYRSMKSQVLPEKYIFHGERQHLCDRFFCLNWKKLHKVTVLSAK